MSTQEIKNIVVEFYTVTGILMILVTGIFIKIIFPILDKKNTQKLSILKQKVEDMESHFNDDIGDLKHDLKSLITKLDEYIVLLNKSNLKQMKNNSEKNVTFENHEQRLKNLENYISEIKQNNY